LDREKVEGYVERSQEIVDEEPQMDEENTKMKLVNPFIEVLGWDIYSSEVRLEYSVDIATSTTKVDYALLLEDTPVAFIEAKGLDTELSDNHESQITDYMKIDEVDWGILTNGKRFRFFKDSELFEELRLSELPDNVESVRTLSKKSIETGESEKIAERIHERKRAVSRLRNGKDEIAADVTEAVTERVGESVVSVAETEAKEFVDRVVEELENGGTVEARSVEKPETSRETEGVAETRDSAVVDTLARHEINGEGDAKVAVFPARKSGIEFLEENNAWGFVRIGQDPDYVGMYIAKPAQEVRYFAEVDSIVPATEADLASPLESYVDMAKFDRDKKVVRFKEGSLHKLEDPIPHGEYTPQGMSYTTLEKFKRAEQTGDLR
jgi:hypothetical protein